MANTVLKKTKIQMTTRNTFLNIPAKFRDMMKLEKGDELLMEYDKKTDIMTIRRLPKCEEEQNNGN